MECRINITNLPVETKKNCSFDCKIRKIKPCIFTEVRWGSTMSSFICNAAKLRSQQGQDYFCNDRLAVRVYFSSV